MVVRILLVDDHEIMREGMCALLRRCEEIEVVGQASDGRAAVELVNELHPDVVIMDIRMPNLNGIDATRQMMQLCPDLKVMALSSHSDVHIIGAILKAGASGYMHKDSTFTELKSGIVTMLEGQTFLCSRISQILFSEYINLATNPHWIEGNRLSRREREVLQLVCDGLSSKEIAEELNLSPKTVDSHREHIMKKLSIRNISELTKYAIREGLTSTEVVRS